VRDDGAEITVMPDWPRYAFLDLRYPRRHGGEPLATASVMVWTTATFGMGGRLVEPGHARFAYLPEGRYLAEISWWKNNEAAPFALWRTRGTMDLSMGLNVFEVGEDDVSAEANR
jgi:hypothetical protein